MFVQLEELYINLDKIVALGVYEIPSENGTQLGLLLNNEKFCVYNVEGGQPSSELRTELQENMRTILKDIISLTKEDIQKIQIPRPDMSKFQEAKEEEPKKEQIND